MEKFLEYNSWKITAYVTDGYPEVETCTVLPVGITSKTTKDTNGETV